MAILIDHHKKHRYQGEIKLKRARENGVSRMPYFVIVNELRPNTLRKAPAFRLINAGALRNLYYSVQ